MKFYGNGVVWDAENDMRLCKFIGGELETDDERVQGELIRLGYEHGGEAKAEPEPTPEPASTPETPATPETSASTGKSFSQMNKTELLAAAELLGVDLSDCTNNKKRAAKLRAASKGA